MDGVAWLGDVAFDLLPLSPFIHFNRIAIDNAVLGGIAWLVPLAEIIALLQAWLVAIATWYIAKIGLRWIKMIQ